MIIVGVRLERKDLRTKYSFLRTFVIIELNFTKYNLFIGKYTQSVFTF